MWWATRLTFHSQRVLRHLTRLLLASGSFTESKRTLFLYVQLVSKSRETQAGDTTLEAASKPSAGRKEQGTKGVRASMERTGGGSWMGTMETMSREDIDILAGYEEHMSDEARKGGEPLNDRQSSSTAAPPPHSSASIFPPNPAPLNPEELPSSARPATHANDSDNTFLSMLLFGIRMLCRYGDEEDIKIEAVRLMGLAMEVVGSGIGASSSNFGKDARADVLAVRGILRARLVAFGELHAPKNATDHTVVCI